MLYDIITKGAPDYMTAQFQKIAGEQARDLMRVTEGEKVKVETSNTLNVNELLAKEKEKEDEDEK